MSSASFDFAPLLPAGLPPPAARWSGRVKYDFTGGNNDADRLPLDGLIKSRSRLRLCFASPSHEEIHQGVAALAEVCRREFGVPAPGANVDRVR